MTPGEVLKALRLRHGLTQAQLAEAVGLDRSWVNQMETGKRPIGPSPRAKFAAYFNVSPLEFGGETAEDPQGYRTLVDRLESIEADIGRLLDGQATGQGALEVILERLDAAGGSGQVPRVPKAR